MSSVASNELAFAVRDDNPVTKGHTLILPRRPIATWFDATREEQFAILALVHDVKLALDRDFHPDGYSVGFDTGDVAGQTDMHLHVHVIPRYRGDTADPRGGIAERQKYGDRAALKTESPTSDLGRPYRYLSPPTIPPRPPPPFSKLPAFVHGDDTHFEHAVRAALLEADRADILAAFVQTSGVALLVDDLRDALTRGAQIRLLTGDYLGITSADALRMLLRLSEEHARFTPFFFETSGNTPFHPKSYIFLRGDRGVAYVGSSNISRSAMQDGVEWNLRLVSSSDEVTFAAVRARFEHLLANPRTKALTRAVIDAYEARAPIPTPPTPEPRGPAPTPNEIQHEALEALRQTRRDGHRKGLVVLATGLGKTYLAAFDFKAMAGERALFVAHREEILDQAKDSWQAVFPEKVVGSYDGTVDAKADLVFASVQTLSRARHLGRFAPDYFDYIVVDEFHHAAAATYRKILSHFHPRFLLGLTATPDRMDGRSLLELCDDNLVHRRDLIHGISRRLLVPFHYFGIRDDTDYEHIPWRSGKFDAAELTNAVATAARASQTLREYRLHSPPSARRTLCFCCTTEHADFMAAFFVGHGVAAAAVHSGPTSAPRGKSLRDLRSGELEIICAVDVFNEGLDLPDINTILMLRPTESPVIFLQQLGRGLRRAEGKGHLTVIDFIGNHTSFLTKPQSLVYLLGQDLPPLVALKRIQDDALGLPEGCTIDISVEAIDLLKSLVRTSHEDIAVFEYMTFRDAHGRRPTAVELFHAAVNFAPIVKSYSTWFHFVREQGDLGADEAALLAQHEAWFGDLLRTKMSKAYKMLALRALVDGDALFVGMDLEDNARRAFESARRDLLLFREMREDEERASFTAAFVRQWREMPLQIWTRGESTSQRWFEFDGDRFVPLFKVAPEQQAVFEQMTEELIELRLQQHRDRLIRGRPLDATEAPIVLKVSHANSRPILRFDRSRRADIPSGAQQVDVDGETYVFDFQKIAVNVATREGTQENVLPALMRKWLGPTAGLPGTRHQVKLVRDADTWRLEPVAPASPGNEPGELVLWGEYNRDSIAAAFGSVNDPSWKVGHRDIDADGKPNTILMVTLRKAGQTKMEHRYADRFLTPSSLQWDSQASTKAGSLKGRRIIGHATEQRTIHLFVQYDSHSPFTYVGPVAYVSHEGEAPLQVEFTLAHPLPDQLWRLWSR